MGYNVKFNPTVNKLVELVVNKFVAHYTDHKSFIWLRFRSTFSRFSRFDFGGKLASIGVASICAALLRLEKDDL